MITFATEVKLLVQRCLTDVLPIEALVENIVQIILVIGELTSVSAQDDVPPTLRVCRIEP